MKVFQYKRPLVFLTCILTLVCSQACRPQATKDTSNKSQNTEDAVQVEMTNGMKHAYFASGCFWCVEAIYESVRGVKEVISGYSGGHTLHPTYEETNTGRTGHAETVEVIYNPEIVSFATLLDVYFGSQNITQINGQGPDKGSQYRSILFYQNQMELDIINRKIDSMNLLLNGPKVAAEVLPFQKFWKAENYHQNYERLNPNNPYIKNISVPRLKRFQEKFPELLKTEKYH